MAEEKVKNIEAKSKDIEVKKGGAVAKPTPSRALSPFEEMDRLFERFFTRPWARSFMSEWPSLAEGGAFFDRKLPRVDVIDRDDEVVVRVEVPGVDKKDLDVSVTDNTVSISGITSREEKEERGDYYRSEISHGSFSRVVALPSDVNSDKARAKFRDGLVELTLPKIEKSKRKKIAID
ncbi:MAG TPA: heat-shock protein Hsp20 [Porticoccaceae bacterium]|nr:heat-shock protein Hsp20 [Porticoccaceae bacterium]